jgi:hypothetical protein
MSFGNSEAVRISFMNVSAASSGDLQALLHQRYLDFNSLQSALQTGNISSAQGAFTAFLQDIQQTTLAAGPNGLFSPGSQPAKDLQNLGSALKSADLAGANQAFASLKQDLQASNPAANLSEIRAHLSHNSHALVAANGVESIAANANPALSAQAAAASLSLQV